LKRRGHGIVEVLRAGTQRNYDKLQGYRCPC
jgi:hypothetical protein